MQINQTVEQAFIVCYREDLTDLERALRAEKINNITRISREYTEQELTYSKQSRCLIGHYDAWQAAKKSSGLSLIVEADFVPSVGFGDQLVPFSKNKIGSAWGWLYSCARRVYEFDGSFIRGHSATTVAYLIDAEAAAKIEGFVEHEFAEHPPQGYSPWDTYIRMYAQRNGVAMYLPFRSYGEHGGIANKEHKSSIKNPNHQADYLINHLHFLPGYARGSRVRYYKYRFFAYTRAWLRLFALKYVESATLRSNTTDYRYKARLCLMAVKRLIPFVGNSLKTRN